MDYKTTQTYTTNDVTTRYQLEALRINYMNMKTLGDVNTAIEELKDELSNEYIPEKDKYALTGAIKALEWVTGNYRISKHDVVDLIANMNEVYKQMTIYDYLPDDDIEVLWNT